MTIYRLLENTTFGPEEIERLVKAYEQALRALGLVDRSDPITLLVAEKIIAVGWFGIENPVSGTKLLLSCVSHTYHRIRIAQSMSIRSSSSLQINSQEWALCLKMGNLVKGNLSWVI